jgi:hypothetical protein
MYDPQAIEAMTAPEWARLAGRLSEAEIRSALTYLSGYDPHGVAHALNFVRGGGEAALVRAAGLAGRPVDAEPAQSLASCGHPANEDGECDYSSWPERAPYGVQDRHADAGCYDITGHTA